MKAQHLWSNWAAGLRSNLFATQSIIPHKKQAEFKDFKKQTTIWSIFRKLPSIQRVKVKQTLDIKEYNYSILLIKVNNSVFIPESFRHTSHFNKMFNEISIFDLQISTLTAKMHSLWICLPQANIDKLNVCMPAKYFAYYTNNFVKQFGSKMRPHIMWGLILEPNCLTLRLYLDPLHSWWLVNFQIFYRQQNDGCNLLSQ